LPFLLLAVGVSVVGIVVVLLRNRQPNTMNHSISEFERGLRALDPDGRERRGRSREQG
jgi:hypothetical protein